jgi:hypothetical protein
LGVPLLAYTFFIDAFVWYLVANFAGGEAVSYLGIMAYQFAHPALRVGPLWFVEALLIFSGLYVLSRVVTRHFIRPFQDTFPTNKAIIASIAAIALGTFIVRIWYPIGVSFHNFQLAHHVHYAFCFLLGILAYRGRWLEHLSESRAKPWKAVAILAIVFLPIILVLGLGSGLSLEAFLGGLSLGSLVVCLWESVACLSIIISLLYVFQRRFNKQGALARWMAPNFYAVYIVHQFAIVAVMIPFLSIAIPTPVKFVAVSLISLPACFIISGLIRQIPYTRRVLG